MRRLCIMTLCGLLSLYVGAKDVVGTKFYDVTSHLWYQITSVKLGEEQVKVIKSQSTDYDDVGYSVSQFVMRKGVPYLVTELGKEAFFECKALQYVSLPASLNEIGARCFASCTILKSINLKSNIPPILKADVFAHTNDYYVTVPLGAYADYKDDFQWRRVNVVPAAISFGRSLNLLPDEIEGYPAVVRLNVSQANSGFDLMVNFVHSSVKLDRFVLVATSDLSFSDTQHYFEYDFSGLPNVGKNLLLTRSPLSNFDLSGGFDYFFEAFDIHNNVVGAFYVRVVPDYLVWLPSDDNVAWNNDDNWVAVDEYGVPIAGARGFVPLGSTSLFFPDDARSPLLPTTSARGFELEQGATPYVAYDLNFKRSNCRYAYFSVGAKLLNQHLLVYEGVNVELPLKRGEYQLVTPPVGDVVSGDFYIPSGGDSASPFMTPDAVDNRLYNAFTQRVFNSTSTEVCGDRRTVIQSVGWSNPFNFLSMPYLSGHGYAIKNNSTVNQDYVRFPKVATSYAYYADNGDGTESEISESWAVEPITRGGFAYKFVFAPDNSGTMRINYPNTQASQGNKYFLVANPLMADLDMWDFFWDNPLLTGNFWVYGSKALSPATYMSMATLPPLTAFFVESNNVLQSLNVTFSADMGREVSIAPRVFAALNDIDDMPCLTVSAVCDGLSTWTKIIERQDYNDGFVPVEDLPLIMLDADMTPWSIYSLSGDRAVSVNRVGAVTEIPLALSILDSTVMGDVSLSFSGVDEFEDLYFFDAYSGVKTPLTEGLSITLDSVTNNELRYYIKRDVDDLTTDLMDTEGGICFYTNGDVVNISAVSKINSIEVVDLSGRVVWSDGVVDAFRCEFSLPKGVFVVRVECDNCVENIKVIIN